MSRYIRGSRLAKGWHGKVFKCVDRKTNRDLAMKVISKSLSGINFEELKGEVEIMKGLINYNIMRCFDSFEDEDHVYIILEYMEGGNLQQLLYKGRLDEPTIVRMLEQMLMALCCLKDHRIIHGDIKPGNIFLRKDGSIALGGFGCAQQLDSPEDEALGGGLTLRYASPERRLLMPYDYSADIWSLGVVLYEMCTGQYPFESPQNMFEGRYNRINPSVDGTLQKMIKLMLQIEKEKRPSARELLTILNDEYVHC